MIPDVVVGVDPGNASSGISVWAPGADGSWSCAGSATASPWDLTVAPRLEIPGAPERPRAVLAVEVPQNGTHTSRGGVHWAGGMVVRSLFPRVEVKRDRVRKLTPDRWRRLVLGNLRRPDDWKVWALDCCGVLGLDVESEDEAEAVMIGMAGCVMEKLDVGAARETLRAGGLVR